jgi:hypothetical protein
VIAAAPQPPIEDPFDGPRPASRVTLPVDAEEADSLPAPPPPITARRMTMRRRLGLLWRVTHRIPTLRWIKKMITFPIGERFAAISITAALFSAHAVFIVLLVWGGFAVSYVLAGRIFRSLTA